MSEAVEADTGVSLQVGRYFLWPGHVRQVVVMQEYNHPNNLDENSMPSPSDQAGISACGRFNQFSHLHTHTKSDNVSASLRDVGCAAVRSLLHMMSAVNGLIMQSRIRFYSMISVCAVSLAIYYRWEQLFHCQDIICYILIHKRRGNESATVPTFANYTCQLYMHKWEKNCFLKLVYSVYNVK